MEKRNYIRKSRKLFTVFGISIIVHILFPVIHAENYFADKVAGELLVS